MPGRLTWDSLAPAPYESAWSVFLKLRRVNFMNMSELEELIQQEPKLKGRYEVRNHQDSRWIDFDRYASLIGVTKERLEQGFLDRLGIARALKNGEKQGIRHCPQCRELGYHCVLFDLTIIKECPWHRCELIAPCTRCSSMDALDSSGRFYIENGQRICSGCRLLIDRYTAASRLNAIHSDLKYIIIGYCKEFINWWMEVKNATISCPSFITELRYNKSNVDFPSKFTPWLLGFARDRAKNELYWTFSVPEKPASVISRACTIEKESEHSNYYLTDDVGRSFRSIRRHIYKRYLRTHHTCIKHLLNLSHDETQFLHSARVCIPAVAFLTWWMSVEGISNIEGLRSTKVTRIPLRLMAPSFFQYNFPVKDRLRWTYDSFFGILAALEEAHERYWRLVIVRTELGVCNGFLLSKIMNHLGEPVSTRDAAKDLTVVVPT